MPRVSSRCRNPLKCWTAANVYFLPHTQSCPSDRYTHAQSSPLIFTIPCERLHQITCLCVFSGEEFYFFYFKFIIFSPTHAFNTTLFIKSLCLHVVQIPERTVVFQCKDSSHNYKKKRGGTEFIIYWLFTAQKDRRRPNMSQRPKKAQRGYISDVTHFLN